MAMTTEELIDRLRFEEASDALEELTGLVETMRYAAPEALFGHVQEASETLNEFAVALCIIVPEGE